MFVQKILFHLHFCMRRTGFELAYHYYFLCPRSPAIFRIMALIIKVK